MQSMATMVQSIFFKRLLNPSSLPIWLPSHSIVNGRELAELALTIAEFVSPLPSLHGDGNGETNSAIADLVSLRFEANLSGLGADIVVAWATSSPVPGPYPYLPVPWPRQPGHGYGPVSSRENSRIDQPIPHITNASWAMRGMGRTFLQFFWELTSPYPWPGCRGPSTRVWAWAGCGASTTWRGSGSVVVVVVVVVVSAPAACATHGANA